MKNKKLIVILAITIGVLLTLVWVSRAGATAPEPYKVICHHNPGNNVTLSFQNEQSYSGHLGTPHNDQVFDTEGECPPDQDPTCTPTPTPLPDFCPEDEGYQPYGPCQGEEITPTPTPTDEPEVTPTVEPTTPPSPFTDGRSDGKTDGKSDGRVSTPQTIPSCDVPGNCINK